MKKIGRGWRVLIGVVGFSCMGFWAPNHQGLNQQIWDEGKPWGQAGFKRAGRPIATVKDYLTNYWYLGNAEKVLVVGVPFKTTGAPTQGMDLPTDLPTTVYTLRDWN